MLKQIIPLILFVSFISINCLCDSYLKKLHNKTENIELKRIEYMCICPDWLETKYGDTIDSGYEIYIEANNDSIKLPEKYRSSAAYYNNKIIFTGKYYSKKGVSRDYKGESNQRLKNARVFNYTNWKIITPFELIVGYDSSGNKITENIN